MAASSFWNLSSCIFAAKIIFVRLSLTHVATRSVGISVPSFSEENQVMKTNLFVRFKRNCFGWQTLEQGDSIQVLLSVFLALSLKWQLVAWEGCLLEGSWSYQITLYNLFFFFFNSIVKALAEIIKVYFFFFRRRQQEGKLGRILTPSLLISWPHYKQPECRGLLWRWLFGSGPSTPERPAKNPNVSSRCKATQPVSLF